MGQSLSGYFHERLSARERQAAESRFLAWGEETLAGLANVYTHQKRYPEAEFALRNYLKSNSQNANVHLQLARLLMAQQKPDAAIPEYETAMKLARQIASKSALTVKIGKEAFYRQLEMGLADAYRFASDVMVENMLARDAEEGIGAFIEKRTPSWEDR